MLIITIKVFLFLRLFVVQSTTMLYRLSDIKSALYRRFNFLFLSGNDFCLYILSLITPKFKDQDQVGLYRDNGIALRYVQSDPKANRKKLNKQ